MKRKLYRPRRSVFRQRRVHPVIKVFGTLLICVAVIAAGFFSAMFISKHSQDNPHKAVGGSAPHSSNDKPGGGDSQQPAGDVEAPDAPKDPIDTPASLDTIRAFHLSFDALKVDSLPSTLSAARKAGFTAVTFDLKDADGKLYYLFSNAQAKKVGYADGALSADTLTALMNSMKEHGLAPIPRLYAFCDDPAAKVLTDARISHTANHTWAWYDGDPNNGGKKWLNPYAPAAQDYITSLAKELKDKGAAAILLDGVQFPAQLKDAYLGEEAATVTKDAALTAFVTRVRNELGSDCPLILACTAKGALATDTKIYGGNPVTFGATVISPLLSSKVQESVEKTVLRLQGPDITSTSLAPLLQAQGFSAKQVNEAIAACVKGGAKSFILVADDYDFASYTLP